MLIIYLAVLGSALYWVVKMLMPEMRKSPPMPRPSPMRNSGPSTDVLEDRVQKLESLLAEKNKNIGLLQTELKIFHIQVRNFDKIKTMLEEEIHRLREQNRIFRSELGLPATHSRENSIA